MSDRIHDCFIAISGVFGGGRRSAAAPRSNELYTDYASSTFRRSRSSDASPR